MDKSLIFKLITAAAIVISIWLRFNSKTKTNKKMKTLLLLPLMKESDDRGNTLSGSSKPCNLLLV